MERKGIVAASEKAGSGWISVKDRLPGSWEQVLVCTTIHGTRCVCEGLFELQFFLVDRYIDPNVTHWMPLPEPPKDGE